VPGVDPPSEKARVEALVALGLPRRARLPEIRARYLDLARELHPDVKPDDPAAADRFRTIAAAYDVLRRYHRHLAPAGRIERDAKEYDPLWWKLFGEKV
jgi:hypothetical protein